RPCLARAAAVVVPIRMGGGTRLKVVEALSMARPIVSTTVGCEGIDVEPGRHLLVADQPEEFASAVCRLLDDPAFGTRLGSAGRDLVVDRYSWQRAGQLLRDLYRQLAPATPAGSLLPRRRPMAARPTGRPGPAASAERAVGRLRRLRLRRRELRRRGPGRAFRRRPGRAALGGGQRRLVRGRAARAQQQP